MKIVQIVASIEAEASGPSYSVLQLARAMEKIGREVELFSLGAPIDTSDGKFRNRKFNRDYERFGHLKKLGLSSKMRKGLVEVAAGAEVLHTHGLWMMPNVYPARVSNAFKVPFVVSPRGMLSPAALEYSRAVKSVFWIIAQRSALKAANLIHATSEQEYEDIRAFGLRQPVVILPNGVGVSHPQPSELPCCDGERSAVVLYLGRLHPIKRIETLLKAWAQLEDVFPNWTLEIRGPGEPNYVKKLKQEAVEHGLQRCIFGDPVYGEKKYELYRRAAVSVLPSASENFAMTVAESLACATPVITTKATPWRGLETYGCGWWVDLGVEPLRHALHAALTSGMIELHQMGTRGQNWMIRDFAWSGIAERMIEAYSWLRGQGSPPPTVIL
ncbi:MULTISPECIES: glycosyltransferase [unclassified Mesorhizobium]|uniref:glycosyltransferase n=1 Tax=unclassified Mesorhizobium TaxID=325217 RepID=UPI0007FD8D4D|nr:MULTISPECIES: glycosyltransferase [unclassified Mesorhizobium]QIA24725.1 glycosyltransferase [Mesorhizobium sp. AA22]RUV28879.1 glycosyltransferase [Mesorhizobium sp. M5C.F.Ca.IN.020.32.2.1]RWG50008.1 MAG: glycosyltransferase [Mesorhizobium sp.]RWH50973.1 MAG: glycosyltransferase [Mesorhizobium sp.]RWH58969.1 MAG: glycosyltransferase [Mesorhizobium sp.]